MSKQSKSSLLSIILLVIYILFSIFMCINSIHILTYIAVVWFGLSFPNAICKFSEWICSDIK